MSYVRKGDETPLYVGEQLERREPTEQEKSELLGNDGFAPFGVSSLEWRPEFFGYKPQK